jgi:hypothetical protein
LRGRPPGYTGIRLDRGPLLVGQVTGVLLSSHTPSYALGPPLSDSQLGQKGQREDAELRSHIIELLNVFEAIATAFRHHAVDRAMVEEQFRATLVRWKNILDPFIKIAWENYRESEGLPWEPYAELVDSYWLKKPRQALIPTAELLNRPNP